MIHDAGSHLQIQSVIGMTHIFSFGVVGRSKVYLSSQTPVRVQIGGYTSHKGVSLQVFASGCELQNIYRIKSGMDKHRTAHILAGSVVERE